VEVIEVPLPPSPPDSNAETVYGTIIAMLFLFGVLWYLLLHPKIAGGLESDILAGLKKAKEATRADWARTKELLDMRKRKRGD
jgi:hypothetical protein